MASHPGLNSNLWSGHFGETIGHFEETNWALWGDRQAQQELAYAEYQSQTIESYVRDLAGVRPKTYELVQAAAHISGSMSEM